MPFNYSPVINPVAPQLAAQGFAQAGEDLKQGIAGYQQNKLMASQAIGKFEGAANANPDILQFLSSENAPPELASAFSSLQKGGSLPVQKAALLAQFADTYVQGKQQKQQMEAQKVALDMTKQRYGFLQSFMGDGSGGGQYSPQPQGSGAPPPGISNFAPQGAGQGQPAPQAGAPMGTPPNNVAPRAIITPPSPITINDPQVRPLYAQALRMTFGDPEKAAGIMQQNVDAINASNKANFDRMASAEKPTGNVYFKRIDYKDGMPQATIYSPEVAVGPGTSSESLKEGPNEISVPIGQQPPGKIVSRGTGAAEGMPASPYNTNDPAWQKDLKDANQAQASSAGLLADAKQLKDAATAYAKAGSSGLNALLGDPSYAKIKQVFTGANPLNDLQIAMAANTNAILAQIRGGTGSTGGRIMQTEYENASKVLGSGTMTNESLLAAANNIYNMGQRQYALDKAYATFRATMPAGEAEKKAVEMFGAPPDLQIGGGKKTPPALVKGQTYTDKAGNKAIWDGQRFIPK